MSQDRNKEKIFERIVEAPASALDSTIAKTEQAAHSFDNSKSVKRTRHYWNILGPGLTTGASDDDPSGIATYSQAGAQFGFGLLWMSIVTFPLMSAVQEMCARIGIVTGHGLAGNIRQHFSKRVLYLCTLLLFAANAFNIGADLGAMAKAFQLLRPEANFYLAVIGFTLLCLVLQIYLPYAKYARFLKWLALVLLAYVASAILAHLNWGHILNQAVRPSLHWSKEEIILITAILGTTISPYLFFWQTSQEVETRNADPKIKHHAHETVKKKEIKAMRADVWSGMLLSNVVMFFIIAACGAILFPQGIIHIQTASQAAEALRPFAGNATYWLFAIGIIGTGLLAIPVLAGSSSYAVSESLQWKEGLNKKLSQAHAFYGILIFSVLIGLSINFLGLDPIKVLIYSAVANGLVAPVVLALIVIISSNRKIMGDWVNKRSTTFVGWFITGLMTIAGGAAIYALFT